MVNKLNIIVTIVKNLYLKFGKCYFADDLTMLAKDLMVNKFREGMNNSSLVVVLKKKKVKVLMRNAWFEEEVHILQICHDYIFLLHGIRKYCLVDYCMDSLFVCEFFIIVRGCVKKNSYTPILPLKKGSPVSLYIPSLVLSHISSPAP